MTRSILQSLLAKGDDRIAVEDDRRALGYSSLAAAVSAQALWLREHRVSRCALLADNSISWVVADLALLQLDAMNVPVPAWFTPAQIEHVVMDAGIDSILTDDPSRIARDHHGFRAIGIAPESSLTLLKRTRGTAQSAPHAAKVTYTSGSTGTAKGVCLSPAAIERVAHSIATVVPAGLSRHLCTMPLATLLENIAGIYVPLLLGGTCVVPSSRRTGVSYGALDAMALLRAISEAVPDSLIIVPELLRVMVAGVKRGWCPPSSLWFIAVGGASVSQSLLDEALKLGLPAYQGYGLSECASVVTLNTPDANRPGSVGKALPHVSVTLDAHGQILVAGVGMSGYLGQAERTSNPIPTGDLGDIDADGYLYVRGRIKNMIVTSMGRNVSPEWVEAELTRNAAIGQAIVIGDSRPWLSALIHPAGPNVTSQHVDAAIAAANAALPEYAHVRAWIMLPSPLSFADALLTANGRPRREQIARRFADRIESLYSSTALAS